MFQFSRRERPKLAGVMEELVNQNTTALVHEKLLNSARKMIERGKMTLEEITEDLNLPLEKVRELAAEKPDS